MIKHIVMWKLDDSYTTEEKQATMNSMKTKLMSLKSEIDILQHIEVFFNDEKAVGANFDVILDTEFTDLEALNAYQIHPAHQEVVKYIKSLKVQRAAIDYSF